MSDTTTDDHAPDEQGHATDEAEMGVRSEGSHAPIVDPEANFDPGDVGSDDPPDSIDAEGDDEQDEREAMLDEVRDD